MVDFRFERRQRYPELDLVVSLSVFPDRGRDYTGRGSVMAKGQPGARQRWRDDFWEWAQSRNLDAVAPRFGNRRIDEGSVYDCWLKDWQTIADFLVMWVGIEALSDALAERVDERTAASEMMELAASVRMISEKLSLIENYCKRQDAKWGQLSARLVEASAMIAGS